MNIMLDIETTGKRAGCPVLSIGATSFDLLNDFYCTISYEDCLAHGLLTDQSTMAWWLEQDKEAYTEAFSGTLSLRDALHQFSTWFHNLPEETKYIWGNGAAFDMPVLEAAYAACNLAIPWDFRNVRCYRTLKNLYPHIQLPRDGWTEHHALADAKYQAIHAGVILSCI
jgi:hypothetical protein